MGGRVVALDGFESGGPDFVNSSFGSNCSIVTTPTPYEGTYILQCIGSGQASSARYTTAVSLGVDLEHIIGFAFRFTANPSLSTVIVRGSEAGGTTFRIQMNTSGQVFITGSTTSSTYQLSTDTWYYLEGVWANRDSGTSYIYVDGVQRVSHTADFSNGSSVPTVGIGCEDVAQLSNPNTTFFFDNMYVKEDVVLADLIADSSGSAPFVKIAGVYNNTAEDATDQGDTLDDGTWGDMSDVPAADDAADAGYTATAAASGHQISDEGSRSGPSGDGITDTILGAAWAATMKRSGGGSTEHYMLYGHNGDVVTSADLLLANNTWNNYVFVSDVVVQSDTEVPTTSESSAIGIAKNSGGRDGLCQDHYCQLLLEPLVAAGAPPPRLRPLRMHRGVR